jgi:hypothetical protein
MIKLIVAASAPVGGPSRQELQGLSVGDLRKKSLAAGVDSDAIEAARDSDTPKDDMINLIIYQPR